MSAASPLQAFFAMGGYGAYVWPAYAVALIVIAGMVAQTALNAHRQRERLRALEKDGPR